MHITTKDLNARNLLVVVAITPKKKPREDYDYTSDLDEIVDDFNLTTISTVYVLKRDNTAGVVWFLMAKYKLNQEQLRFSSERPQIYEYSVSEVTRDWVLDYVSKGEQHDTTTDFRA